MATICQKDTHGTSKQQCKKKTASHKRSFKNVGLQRRFERQKRWWKLDVVPYHSKDTVWGNTVEGTITPESVCYF